MLVLPFALLVLGTLLPSSLATAPSASFTNGHMSPRNRPPGWEHEDPPMRGQPGRLGVAGDAHQVTEVDADVVEEPNPMEPTKTHEQLIAEELQRREEELQSRTEEDIRRSEEQGRRDAELRLRAEEQARRDAELKRRTDEAALVQRKLELQPATVVLHKAADIVEDSKPMEPKTHLQLVAEELQRREDEMQSRAEEQGRRDAELRLRAEEQARRDEVLKQRAEAELLVQQELELRAAFEERQNAAAASSSGPLPDGGHLREPSTGDQEEFSRPQGGGRGGFRPSRFHVDETLPEDARNKRHEELDLYNQNKTSDDIAIRKEEEARRHTENLSRQEEIEIEHLETGLAHEANGTDQHQREAYEHDLINQEREDMIKKQEMERQRLEKEVERQEEIRKFQERERLQGEQEVIIQEENQKRHMTVDTKPRSDAHDWEAHNGVSVSSSIGWAFLFSVVLANTGSYYVC